MNTQFIERWVETLRTTAIPQTTGYLVRTEQDPSGEVKQPVGMCCLGVACEIIVTDESIPVELHVEERSPYSGGRGGVVKEFNSESGVLPRAVAKYIGVETNPSIVIKNLNYVPGLRMGEALEHIPNSKCPVWRYDNTRHLVNATLSSLNDAGFTFSQIADLIDYAGLSDYEVNLPWS